MAVDTAPSFAEFNGAAVALPSAPTEAMHAVRGVSSRRGTGSGCRSLTTVGGLGGGCAAGALAGAGRRSINASRQGTRRVLLDARMHGPTPQSSDRQKTTLAIFS